MLGTYLLQLNTYTVLKRMRVLKIYLMKYVSSLPTYHLDMITWVIASQTRYLHACTIFFITSKIYTYLQIKQQNNPILK